MNLDIEGSPPPSFKWYRNGYLLDGQVQRSLVIESVTKGDAGTYSCEVSNVAGQFVWVEATVSIVN